MQMNCPNCGYVLNPGKSCKKKHRFRTFKTAENAWVNTLLSKKGLLGHFDGLRPYKCNFCGGFHLGHKPDFKREEGKRE